LSKRSLENVGFISIAVWLMTRDYYTRLISFQSKKHIKKHQKEMMPVAKIRGVDDNQRSFDEQEPE